MAKLDDLKKELLPLVLEHACYRFKEPIKLASGKMSQSYFDGRRITLHPKGAALLARTILELIDITSIDAVGGPTLGADPIVTAVSIFAWLDKKKELPAFLIRKEAKEHGLQKQIEGLDLKPGMKCLIVEDVITSGKSVKRAISAVEEVGAKVVAVICLLDREEGGAEALKPCELISVFKRAEVNL